MLFLNMVCLTVGLAFSGGRRAGAEAVEATVAFKREGGRGRCVSAFGEVLREWRGVSVLGKVGESGAALEVLGKVLLWEVLGKVLLWEVLGKVLLWEVLGKVLLWRVPGIVMGKLLPCEVLGKVLFRTGGTRNGVDSGAEVGERLSSMLGSDINLEPHGWGGAQEKASTSHYTLKCV
jgi:ribosomal protein S28E/S33